MVAAGTSSGISSSAATLTAPSAPAWRRQLADAFTSTEELLAALGLSPGEVGMSATAAGQFPLRVPRGFVARMRPGDPRDPLLLQVLPAVAETVPAPGFDTDPLAESEVSPLPGLLQKFAGRVLVIATGACAVHCRYCFRRHFPYGEHGASKDGWAAILGHIASDETISEVILSGGDPLVLADDKLADLAFALAEIPHVERLRVHSRLPIVLPERVDAGLLAWLGDRRLQTVMVVHANHPREIDGSVASAIGRMRDHGVHVLNQSVILAGINDDVATLTELSFTLMRAGVLPYYLHLLDPVAGAAHFDVDLARARALHRGLAARLPGYLVPRLVREVPGAPSKVPVGAPGE